MIKTAVSGTVILAVVLMLLCENPMPITAAAQTTLVDNTTAVCRKPRQVLMEKTIGRSEIAKSKKNRFTATDNSTAAPVSRLVGGWSMSLTRRPLREFDYIMYGMVTNLANLTTGTVNNPGWSPEEKINPRKNSGFPGKVLWVYGGGGCFPASKPANIKDISRIVSTTQNSSWDGVDFDDECNMNTALMIETMTQLKKNHKQTSMGFIAGYTYNHPETPQGRDLNNKIKAVIASRKCDLLVHYCYAAAMWHRQDIIRNVKAALQRSICHGMPSRKIILALTTAGLTNWSLNYFLDQIIDLDLGGLFIWRYEKLKTGHRNLIRKRLKK